MPIYYGGYDLYDNADNISLFVLLILLYANT